MGGRELPTTITARVKRLRDWRKANKLCIKCGKPNSPYRCKKCRLKETL